MSKDAFLSLKTDRLRDDYGWPDVTDVELYAADLMTQIRNQELHHGPVRLEALDADRVRMVTTSIDEAAEEVDFGEYPAAAADHASRMGFLMVFGGWVTVTAQGVEWLNPLRVCAGWSDLPTPVMSLVAVVSSARRVELVSRPEGRRIFSYDPDDAGDVIAYRWLVPEAVVQEAIASELLLLVDGGVQRAPLADGLPDTYREIHRTHDLPDFE